MQDSARRIPGGLPADLLQVAEVEVLRPVMRGVAPEFALSAHHPRLPDADPPRVPRTALPACIASRPMSDPPSGGRQMAVPEAVGAARLGLPRLGGPLGAQDAEDVGVAPAVANQPHVPESSLVGHADVPEHRCRGRVARIAGRFESLQVAQVGEGPIRQLIADC